MKKITILFLAAILNLSCNAQEKEKINNELKENKDIVSPNEKPKGTWKVDKEFDEYGNMIRYDSIYSWSSGDIEELAENNSDSLLQSFRSRFYNNFSKMDKTEFEDIFSRDSLFTKRFFDDDFFGSQFGEDFMDIDRIHKRMERMQKEFLEKYQREFKKPESDDSENDN